MHSFSAVTDEGFFLGLLYALRLRDIFTLFTLQKIAGGLHGGTYDGRDDTQCHHRSERCLCVLKSKKGALMHHRKPRKHGEGVPKRRLFNGQLCICVAANRNGYIVVRCVNRVKQRCQDIVRAMAPHISHNSVIICPYNQLVKSLETARRLSCRGVRATIRYTTSIRSMDCIVC